MKDKESIPEKLTLEWIKNHARIHLVGEDFRWVFMAWRNVIFLKISKDWTPEGMDVYVNLLSELIAILSKGWDKIFLVFALSRMTFKKKDAFRYLRANWLEFLGGEDRKGCIVEENKIRRVLLKPLYTVIGKLDKIKVFPDCDEAFGWVREAMISHETITTNR